MRRFVLAFTLASTVVVADAVAAGQKPLQKPAEIVMTIPAPPDVAAPPANALKGPNGLRSIVLRPGTGTKHPGPYSYVELHYAGWTTDGKMFDTTILSGKPFKTGLNEVIKGWQDGIQLMVVGEQRRLWIPERFAYDGAPGMPKGMLVFDVELLFVK